MSENAPKMTARRQTKRKKRGKQLNRMVKRMGGAERDGKRAVGMDADDDTYINSCLPFGVVCFSLLNL